MGINGTIFAYGQTGAGKTYSIMGGENNEAEIYKSEKRGVLPHTLDYVFEQLESDNRHRIFISFYEIYNEKIYDLLTNTSHKKAK